MNLNGLFGLNQPITLPHPLYVVAGAAVAAFLLAKDGKHALLLAATVGLLLLVLKSG